MKTAHTQSQKTVWVVAGLLVLAAAGMATFVAVDRAGGFEATPEASAARSASAAPATPSAPVAQASARVNITLQSEVEISEVRAPGCDDVDIQGLTAVLKAARSEAPISIAVKLVDGSALQETVVPRADATVQLKRAAAKKPPVAAGTAPATVAGPPAVVKTAPPPVVTTAPPAATPARTSETKIGPKFEKDPYQ